MVAETPDDLAKARWQVKFRTPKLHAARLRRRNPLALARLDMFTLGLCDKRQNLQH